MDNTQKYKKYLGVQFRKTSDVVPKKWVVGAIGVKVIISWPPSNVQEKSKEREAPQENWKTSNATILCQSGEFYK